MTALERDPSAAPTADPGGAPLVRVRGLAITHQGEHTPAPASVSFDIAMIEIYGPLFMSYPVMSNLQYRLTEVDGGTLIAFHHIALGFIQGEHRTGVAEGWKPILERVRRDAESGTRR